MPAAMPAAVPSIQLELPYPLYQRLIKKKNQIRVKYSSIG